MATESRRTDLCAAGWRVIDDLPLESALGAFSTRAVAEEAGVTTGSFFHHFANARAFTDALVVGLSADEIEQAEQLPDLLDALEARDIIELLRDVMSERWHRHRTEPERYDGFRREMLAWTSHERPLSSPTQGFATVGDVLCHRMRTRQDDVSHVWDLVLERVGRTLVEPFTIERLSTAFTALFYGLGIRHSVEPDAVDDDLFADLVSVLVSALSKPVGSDRHLSDVAERLTQTWSGPERTPQARSGARRRADTRSRIVDASVGMFVDGWESVTGAEVAERAGVSNQTVANLFAGVRTVAACTFRVHNAAIAGAAGSAAATSPVSRVRAVLEEVADRAATDPEPARALLSERIATIARRGALFGDGDVRIEVPLTYPLVGPLRRLTPHADAEQSASMLVHFVLCEAVSGTGTPSATAERAMALLGQW